MADDKRNRGDQQQGGNQDRDRQRQPRRHARIVIHILRKPRRPADLLDQLFHEVGDDDGLRMVDFGLRIVFHF